MSGAVDERGAMRKTLAVPRTRESSTVPEYRSEDLLKTTRQAAIVHRGQRYILRETRTGKLILYK